MKINISKKQYRTLMKLSAISEFVLEDIEDVEFNKDIKDTINYMGSLAKEFGEENIICKDDHENYYFNDDYFEENLLPFIEDFEEFSFWEELGYKLGKRDAILELGEKAKRKRNQYKKIFPYLAVLNQILLRTMDQLKYDGSDLSFFKAKENLIYGMINSDERLMKLDDSNNVLNILSLIEEVKHILIQNNNMFFEMQVILINLGLNNINLNYFKLIDQVQAADEIMSELEGLLDKLNSEYVNRVPNLREKRFNDILVEELEALREKIFSV
ncbi:MAG: hypothetical protein ABIA04_04125 [Pseudomonadota bacterium]